MPTSVRSDTSEVGARAVWGARFHAALRGRSLPLVWTPDALAPAASLWAGARRWVRAWREAGLAPGDRVVLALPAGPGFVMALVGAMGEGLTVAPVPPAADAAGADALVALADTLDARAVVVPPGANVGRDPRVFAADGAGVPADDRGAAPAPPARAAPTPGVRLLLRTSGSTGEPRWLGCSDDNLLAVLESHAGALAGADARVLSVLPWHHAFGLVLELLPALLGGAELLRDPAGGRDPDALLALAAGHAATHLNLVPRTAALLAERPAGAALLAGLAGGVVGGAPVSAALAEALTGTRLRVGYGCTEASPGVLLGAPGRFAPGLLGRPLRHPRACEVALGDGGLLRFRGPNACAAAWRDGALVPLAPGRWVEPGDLATRDGDGDFRFLGRAAETFKLANGRAVHARALEAAVRARCAGLAEVLVSCPDGRRVVVACTPLAGAAVPAAEAVRAALGGLPVEEVRVVAVAPEGWVRTAKGELDRRWPTGRDAGRAGA